jgi:tetratricopeptide (TPR) repeat protein
LLEETGRYAEAETEIAAAADIAEKWSATNDSAVQTARFYRAQLLLDQGHINEAITGLESVLTVVESWNDGSMDQTGVFRQALAQAYLRAGRAADAEDQLRRAVVAASKSLGEVHPITRSIRVDWADALRELGKTSAARSALSTPTPIDFSDLPTRHPFNVQLLRTSGLLALAEGSLRDARRLLRRALDLCKACYGSNHWKAQRLVQDLTLIVDSK